MDASFSLSYSLSSTGLHGGTIETEFYDGSEWDYTSLDFDSWNGSYAWSLEPAEAINGGLLETGDTFGTPDLIEISLGLEASMEDLGNPVIEFGLSGEITAGGLLQEIPGLTLALGPVGLDSGEMSVGNAADSNLMDLPAPELEASMAANAGELELSLQLEAELGNGAIGNGAAEVLRIPGITLEAELVDLDAGAIRSGALELSLGLSSTALPAGAASAAFELLVGLQGGVLHATTAAASFEIPVIELSADAFEHPVIGSATIEIPLLLSGSMEPGSWSSTGVALVMNARLRGVTMYSNFGFNSFAYFNGSYWAGGAGGVYALGGESDVDENIEAVVALPISDLGAQVLKRVTAAYIAYRSNGPLELRMKADDDGWYSYVMDETRTGGLYRNRVKLGRGTKGNYWQTEIRNEDGADFSIDKIELEVKALSRKTA